MGKNLFGDLNTDISTKYKLWDYEATLDEIKQKIEDEIDILSKLKHDVVWARRVIDFYDEVMDAIAKDSKLVPLVENLSSLQEFKAEADDILTEERKRQLEAAKKAQEEAKKQSIIEQAKNVDDKITMLCESERDSFWCDEIEDLVALVNGLKSEVKDLCVKLNLVNDLKHEKAIVLQAIICDKEVRQYSNKEDWSKSYCREVIAYVNSVSDKVKKYMKNKWLLDDLVDRANFTIKKLDRQEIEAEQEREEQKIRERKERERKEREDQERREQEKLQREEEARRKEEDRIRKEEEKKRKAEEAEKRKIEEAKRKKEQEEKRKIEQEEKENQLNALKEQFRKCKKNKTVFFGSYIQDKSEKEPIEWIVIEKNDDSVMLLSKRVLDTCEFGNIKAIFKHVSKYCGMILFEDRIIKEMEYMQGIYNWENSYLRQWLNNEFLFNAFNELERELIATQTNSTTYGGWYNPSIQTTSEKVFVLQDCAKIKKGFLKAKATKYAISKFVTNKKGVAVWWLRKTNIYRANGRNAYGVKVLSHLPIVLNHYVGSNGKADYHFSYRSDDCTNPQKLANEINSQKRAGVRPVIVIKL